MLELLQTYDLNQIVIFLVLLGLALKEVLEIFDYFKDKGMMWFTEQCNEQQQEVTLNEIKATIDAVNEELKLLSDSDRDDIKSWLVEKYTFYQENPNRPISSLTMDTIEKRYAHYKAEGGNSYIDNTIIPALREMAKEENRVK